MDEITNIFKDPFSDAINKLEDLLSQSGRVFLLGAGCSKCANLPLTAELTDKTLASPILEDESKQILGAIRSLFDGALPPAHIEDFLSELVDMLAIVSRRATRNATNQTLTLGGADYTEVQLSKALEQIKRAIADVVSQTILIDTHQRFVKALHRPMRPGKVSTGQSIDYLVLNYDTILEDALALSRVSFSDGMDGGVSGWWNPATFDRKDLGARVLKLHGSINWLEAAEGTLPYRVAANVGLEDINARRILIWPASTKYRETQLDPYAQLADRARRAMNPGAGGQRVLVICGYSFGDSHINIEIERALKDSAGDLTVVAFTDDDSPSGKLKEWHESDVSEQVLIFANKGFFHGNDIRKSDQSLLWWKFENITRILEGER
ncbi:MAG: SIR2 family protein [Pseudomonadales bacterium]|nr:SIR2 family protein [Halioglobus sp.]MCP5123441.1 SIR2 family protein [Pseudomonadales bacterium]MCP5193721.1 SIR2 family protein [Pseudomonadales bacterium]